MTFAEHESGNKFQPLNFAIGRRSCYHCTDAACVEICSSGALYKTEKGVVAFDTDKCNGCTYCQSACPFDVPRFRPTDKRIDKCTLCLDRLEEGGIPACVKTCQPEALCFGPREEMIEKGLKRVEFLKKKGFEKAELYGVNEMGGLHTLTVCKHGHEAYGLPTNPVKKDVITMGTAMRTVTVTSAAPSWGRLWFTESTLPPTREMAPIKLESTPALSCNRALTVATSSDAEVPYSKMASLYL